MKLSNVVATPVSGVYKAPLTVELDCPSVSVAPTSVATELDSNYSCNSRNISKVDNNLFFNAQPDNTTSGRLGIYDINTNTMAYVKCPHPTCEASFIYVNGSVYIIGGYNPVHSVRHNKIMKYNADTITDTVDTITDTLPEESTRRSCNAIGSYIYIIGGDTTNHFLSTIYRLDTETDKIEPMLYELKVACHNSASAVYKNRYIYLVGGLGNYKKIQIIDTEKGDVSLLSKDLPAESSGSGAMIKDDFLYVFGGVWFGNETTIFKKNLLDDDSEWELDTQTLADARPNFGYTSDEKGYYHIIGGYPSYNSRYYETGRFGVPSSDIEIRYTQTEDGTLPPDPTYADTLYTTPIELTSPTKHNIKAKAFYIGE